MTITAEARRTPELELNVIQKVHVPSDHSCIQSTAASHSTREPDLSKWWLIYWAKYVKSLKTYPICSISGG